MMTMAVRLLYQRLDESHSSCDASKNTDIHQTIYFFYIVVIYKALTSLA